MASSSKDATIRIWNVKSGELIRKLGDNSNGIHSLVVLPNDLLAYASENDNNIRICDLNSEKTIKILIGHQNIVKCLVSMPNGLLASGSKDKTIRIWDFEKH